MLVAADIVFLGRQLTNGIMPCETQRQYTRLSSTLFVTHKAFLCNYLLTWASSTYLEQCIFFILEWQKLPTDFASEKKKISVLHEIWRQDTEQRSFFFFYLKSRQQTETFASPAFIPGFQK